jgi:hypothetical protein
VRGVNRIVGVVKHLKVRFVDFADDLRGLLHVVRLEGPSFARVLSRDGRLWQPEGVKKPGNIAGEPLIAHKLTGQRFPVSRLWKNSASQPGRGR